MDEPNYSKWEIEKCKIEENDKGTLFFFLVKTDNGELITTEVASPFKALSDDDIASLRKGFMDKMALDMTISAHKQNLILEAA